MTTAVSRGYGLDSMRISNEDGRYVPPATSSDEATERCVRRSVILLYRLPTGSEG